MTAKGDGPVLGEELRGPLLALVVERGYERREVPFQLSSGGLSHDYVDLRRAVADGPALELAARCVIAALYGAGVEFDAIGGMTMGADPVAHAVALVSGLAWFSVRKAAKTHGSAQRVEGAQVGRGRRVVLFEDTVSTGGSIFEALAVLTDSGAEVVAAVTLLDRGDVAGERFSEAGIRYLPLLTYGDLGIDPVAPAAAVDAPAS